MTDPAPLDPTPPDPTPPDPKPLDVGIDPFDRFDDWFALAQASEPNDANAMTLATADAAGRPAARMLLMKEYDRRGFVFYTNAQSRKGEELAANPFAALLFHWKSRRLQVRIEGPVEAVSDAEADAYFASRARLSRLGALASDQSRPLSARAVFEARVAELDRRYPDAVPRPPHWRGYRVRPLAFEFWQDMPFRLHDRLVYRRASPAEERAGWQVDRLYP